LGLPEYKFNDFLLFFIQFITTMDPKYIYVEGGVAAGKSALLSQLKKTYPDKVSINFEPIEIWQNYKNKYNLLDCLYESPKSFALRFQIVAQITQSKRELDPNRKVSEYNFFERSVRSQKIFIETLFKYGDLKEIDYYILNDFYDVMTDNIQDYIVIYLRTDPHICLERVQSRDRKEEREIQLEYLKVLNEAHDNWLLKLKNCIVLDGNLPIEETAQLAAKYLKM